MQTSKHKYNGHSKLDLYGDFTKIKNILADATSDLNGRTREMIQDSYDNAKDKSYAYQVKIAKYTARRPFKTIGIAFAVGSVLGWFFGRK